MGVRDFFKKAWETTVEVAKTVGNAVVKATTATIEYVYNTAGHIAGRIADAGRAALKSLGKDIETIIDAAGNIIIKTFTKGIDIWFEIKKHYENAKANGSSSSSGGQYSKEESAETLNNIFIFSRGLLHLAEGIKNNPEMQRFDNFARISVSIMFLEDLLVKQDVIESKEKINVRFIDFINKFLSSAISPTETLEFDDLIKKTYGKGLLIIGSEVLIKFWEMQEVELKLKIADKAMAIRDVALIISKLEAQVKNKIEGYEQAAVYLKIEKEKLKVLELEQNELTVEWTDNRDMAGVSKGLLFVMNSDGKASKSVMLKGHDAGEILVRWKNGTPPNEQERNKIREFYLLAEAERKRQEQQQKTNNKGTQL